MPNTTFSIRVNDVQCRNLSGAYVPNIPPNTFVVHFLYSFYSLPCYCCCLCSLIHFVPSIPFIYLCIMRSSSLMNACDRCHYFDRPLIALLALALVCCVGETELRIIHVFVSILQDTNNFISMVDEEVCSYLPYPFIIRTYPYPYPYELIVGWLSDDSD
jgi:hypothetical protein